MFKFPILIGLYSYCILLIGAFGFLERSNIVIFTLIYVLLSIIFFLRIFKLRTFRLKELFNNRLVMLLLFLILIQAFVNIVGAMGPEIAFDALWYHLTLPKLYILNHTISHIPGQLLYYSEIPRLVEMLYMSSMLITGTEISAKFIHYFFGLATLAVIYKIGKRVTSDTFSLIAVLIFYSNLVVGWESISAYVDLARAFFEALSFYMFLRWLENKSNKYLVGSSILLGLAAATKLVAMLDIFIYLILIYYSQKENINKVIKNCLTVVCLSILSVSPWLIYSYLNTGNLFYPYFTTNVDDGSVFSLPNLTSLNLNDPISPIYMISVPLIIVLFNKFSKAMKVVSLYIFITVTMWFLTQEQRGTRFLLPYLPVFSVLVAYAISLVKTEYLKRFLILVIILLSITSIGYRFFANQKFISVITGKESKSEFLSKNLNFNFGDFYDTDNYFKNNIKSTDKVLLYGFHNLFYVDFPYIDSTWIKKGDKFNYVAVQNYEIPERFKKWNLIYYNKRTNVKLYTYLGEIWMY